MARKQFQQVPRRIGARFREYLFHRSVLMQHIEEKDLQQLKSVPPDAP
jgi:hypothetical protein